MATPSQTQTQPQVPDDAYARIQHEVYAPVFFQKLAAAGIQAQSEQEALVMLQTAEQLRQVHAASRQKQASANTSVLAAMQQQLGQRVAAAPSGYSAAEIEKAAAQLASRPELAHAVLSLHAAAQPSQ